MTNKRVFINIKVISMINSLCSTMIDLIILQILKKVPSKKILKKVYDE